jgi:putative phage-type endonuclease
VCLKGHIWNKEINIMKIINLTQNTPEWLSFRREHIGASDASVIMGLSPYRSVEQLYLDKTQGQEQRSTASMQRGLDLEPMAREIFLEAYKNYSGKDLDLFPTVVESEEYPFMSASLDGLDQRERVIVEIKCPNSRDHQMAKEGKIPEHYQCQMQHQMAVCGYGQAWYFSYKNDSDWVMLPLERDENFIYNMICEEKKFFDSMTGKAPAPESRASTEEGLLKTAYEYIEIKNQIAELTKKEKLLKQIIEIKTNGCNATLGDVKVKYLTRRGAVDYEKLCSEQSLDLEVYRKPDTTYCMITS